MPKLDRQVRNILDRAQTTGPNLTLPQQLDRADYTRVDKVLTALGGKWNRKAKAHVFPGDAAEALARVLATGDVPVHARKAEGWVPTPAGAAADLCHAHTNIADLPAGARVLEPSAGDGALVRVIRAANPRAFIVAVEPVASRAASITAGDSNGRITVVTSTFEAYGHTGPAPFDAVFMNPPFSILGQPSIWVDHVRSAWDLTAPGGRLTAIVPGSFAYRSDRRHVAIRDLVKEHGGWQGLPAGTFAEHGTDVHTAIIWADKPRAVAAAGAGGADQLSLFE